VKYESTEYRDTSSAVVGEIERNRGRKPRKERVKENRKEGDLIVSLRAMIVQAVVSGSGMAGALFWLDIDYFPLQKALRTGLGLHFWLGRWKHAVLNGNE